MPKTVVGVALNFFETLRDLSKAPANPVFYLKPSNTWLSHGDPIPCPTADSRLRMAGTLGIVIGPQPAFCVVNDVSIPHDSYFRPAIRQRCSDGFCSIGPVVETTLPDSLEIRVYVNNILRSASHTSSLVRSVAELRRSLSEFLTLSPGDILLIGEPDTSPLAAPGDVVRVEIPGLPPVENLLVLPQPAFLRHSAKKVLALGLNYPSHARELAFQPPTEPLVFLKNHTSLTGSHSQTPRPSGVKFMHYECELAVVIGQTARRIPRARAYDYIAGYSVANDYAIRDYLEDFYRPNLRVKSRDNSTPVLPAVVSVADPMNLQLTTSVNGRVTQRGCTRDMIFDIPFLVEYLSEFMTLQPGDLILTGTPEGLENVNVGDEVITEIEGIGRLVNTIVKDERS